MTSSNGNELVFGSCLSFLLLLLLLLVPYLTLTSVLRENTNSEKGASCVYVWALQWFQFCSAASPTPFSFSFLMSNGIRKDVPLKRCVPPLAIAPEAARSLFVCVCVCVWLLFLFPEEVLLELLLGFSPFGFSHRVYSNSCLSVSFFTHVGLSLNNTDFVRFSAPNWNVCRSTQLSVLAPFRVLFYSPSTLFRIFL